MPTGPLFTFAQVTDVHVQSKHDCLRPFVEAVNAATNHERPDFIAFTGDMTVSGQRIEEEWALVRQDLEALEVPFYFAHGNHKEYRWVQVFADRIEHRCIRSSEEPQEAWFYRGCTDRDHTTEEVYHAGNPAERDFTIRTG